MPKNAFDDKLVLCFGAPRILLVNSLIVFAPVFSGMLIKMARFSDRAALRKTRDSQGLNRTETSLARAKTRVNLGRVIGQHRKILGISQEEFAFRAGLHRTYVSDVERGARNPSLDTLLRIAQALGMCAWILVQSAETQAREDSSTND